MNINEAFQSAIEHYRAGNLQQAEYFCKEILKQEPADSEALQLLGVIYYESNKYDDAILYLRKSLQYDPDNAEAYHLLGYVFHIKGEVDKAIDYYQKTLQLNPNHASASYNLGTAFQGKHQLDEAITYYQKALQIDPNLMGAYYNLGTVFQEKKRPDEAIACYQKAIRLNPNIVDPYYNMGLVLQEQGRLDEAVAAYDMALKYNPAFFMARWAKCMSQLPIIHPDASSIESSRKRYHTELIKFRESMHLETPRDISSAAEAIGKQQPFFLAYQGMNDRELQQIYGDLVCQIMSSKYPEFAERPAMPRHFPGEPLRVGIVSGYFYYHAVWKIPIKGWIENLDRQRFKLYGYYTGRKKDNETGIARQCFSRFVEGILSFEELCKIIRDDSLHVLIYPEIGMDPTTIKLASLRLAPVQCASWGHPDTSGLPTIDYFLSSDLIEPPDANEHYAERLIRLPKLSIYYTPPEIQNVVVNRETFGLRPDSILYHCFQSLYKHLPQYDEIFPRIAQQAGNCQFLFVSYPEAVSVREKFQSRIRQAFNTFGLNADDYVVYLPPLAPELYQALTCLCDIYLDTIGWSGCNSVLEALACNLPVVTLPTSLMRGREGFAIHTMIGVTEMIASSVDDYVGLAVKLGKDLQYRKRISDKIAARKHLAYRDKAAISGLEDFIEKAVRERLEKAARQRK